ncbi:MAG TPA: endolytic transglycosylase MltG [Bacteroidota bacterium]
MSRVVRPVLILIVGLLLLGLLFLLYAAFWPNSFHGAAERTFFVSRGQSVSEIEDSLSSRGIIRDKGLFTFLVGLHGGVPRFQVGKYLFRSGVSNYTVFQDLRSGKGTALIQVLLREGLTARHQARILSHVLGIDSTAYLRLVDDTAFAASLGFPGETLEGYLMPDTYAFAWQPDERDVIRKLTGEFKRFYTDSLQRQQEALGFSQRQIVTVASLVEGETHLSDERPVIAGVYYNRLRRGMRLEADPTIQYLLEGGPRRLFYTDLTLDSPYNTYRHAGLPPGPVDNPGRASILAALFPAHHQYLFFVANGQGGHWFSDTYDAHLQHVRMARRLRRLAEGQAR